MFAKEYPPPPGSPRADGTPVLEDDEQEEEEDEEGADEDEAPEEVSPPARRRPCYFNLPPCLHVLSVCGFSLPPLAHSLLIYSHLSLFAKEEVGEDVAPISAAPAAELASALDKMEENAFKLESAMLRGSGAAAAKGKKTAKGAKKAAGGPKKASSAGGKAAPAKWNWRADLSGIFQKSRGLERLQSPETPSTTIIGNWGILGGVARLSETRSLGATGFQCRLLMGKKIRSSSKVDAPLSSADSEERITEQWNMLRSAFHREDTVLLFHLKNHYALIFALKEWVEEGQDGSHSRYKREILTARKGQRPSAWIDFYEARETMLGWEGYKIMALTRGKSTTAGDYQNSTTTAVSG